jgi:alpha-glucosidase
LLQDLQAVIMESMTSPTTLPSPGTDLQVQPWWRSAVIYQVYPRSFADADGNGIGDLAGVTARLPYLAELGVDALWLSPIYVSPMADAGYDVADYRAVDPVFGSLDDADRLIARAHELGLRVLLDLVPNHTSDEHAWFRAALAAPPGSASGRGTCSATVAAPRASCPPTRGAASSAAGPGPA